MIYYRDFLGFRINWVILMDDNNYSVEDVLGGLKVLGIGWDKYAL
jgi:hypothetical protein